MTYCGGDKYDELHDSVRSRYVTIIILTMALLCASSLLRARYPFCLLSSRRIATETGQVCLQFFLVCIRSIFAQLRRTGLYDFHVENGAKMVPFAGYSMPLSYADVGQSEAQAIIVFETSPQFSQSPVITMYGAV